MDETMMDDTEMLLILPMILVSEQVLVPVPSGSETNNVQRPSNGSQSEVTIIPIGDLTQSNLYGM